MFQETKKPYLSHEAADEQVSVVSSPPKVHAVLETASPQAPSQARDTNAEVGFLLLPHGPNDRRLERA